MTQRIAVYAGSFDPPTKGHLWMISKGASMYDKLIVAVGVNPEKHCLFSVEERLDMLHYSTKDISNAIIRSFPYQYLVHFASSNQVQYILRGIRSIEDYGKEKDMRNINGDLDPNITMVYLIPPRELAEVSSSMVKGLVGPESWEKVVSFYVSDPVLKKLKEKHGLKTA